MLSKSKTPDISSNQFCIMLFLSMISKLMPEKFNRRVLLDFMSFHLFGRLGATHLDLVLAFVFSYLYLDAKGPTV